jgi:co-chaperonin GroES (HSP10)
VTEIAEEQQTASKIPEPTGYRILIAIPRLDEKFENTSIVRPENFAKREEMASVVGLVIKLGPLAYKDEEKFPTGAWCKEGDFIMMRSYSGTRFKIANKEGEQEFRLINDDTVEAVVADPRGITRA